MKNFPARMTRFRPCIDLHQGRVKQIVGGTLTDDGAGLRTNFVSEFSAGHYGEMFRRDGITGAHVILLGPGNEAAAREALAAYPGGLQVGGGIKADNAAAWIAAGASHVIVTSALFDAAGKFLPEKLAEISVLVGPERLVVDLSCRRDAQGWVVAMNRWQTLTDLRLDTETLDRLAPYCAEFLIHAADVEGKMAGMDEALIALLGRHTERPVTYAGGARRLDDLALCERLSHGRVDLTIGSALDIYGGSGVRYADCVAWNAGRR